MPATAFNHRPHQMAVSMSLSLQLSTWLCKMNMTHDRPWTTNRGGHSCGGVCSYGCAQVENQPPRLFAACVSSIKLQLLAIDNIIKMIEESPTDQERLETHKKILSSSTILAKTHMSMSMGVT